jgi:RNA polymerase sigma factor (TIGR02999 family)
MLLAWNKGDAAALHNLLPAVYNELRRLAQHHMRFEASDHTLQATALVNEAYLRLVDQKRVNWKNRAHFFGAAAQIIRRILVDHARRRHRLKRGGDAIKISLCDGIDAVNGADLDVVALDHALQRLAKFDQQQERIIELRFFAGLSIEETAAALDISAATVKRDWSMARAWLHREMTSGKASGI